MFTRTEPLDFIVYETVEFGYRTEGIRTFWIGNSGLRFGLVTPGLLEMHYLPEGSAGTNTVDQATKRKYAIVYCAALFYFLQWYGESALEVKKIKGFANEKMHRFLQKTLNQFSVVYVAGETNWAGTKCEIEMERLISDEQLHSYLRSRFDMCLQTGFMMRV